DEAFRQLENWMEQNPFLRGINWSSALEVALRALSWAWLYQLVEAEFPERLRGRFLAELYRHGRFLELNLSIYFSPNTHLLGEAVALHALGVLFPGWPRAATWTETGGRIVQEQLARQVRPDGSHFEQSAYYHVYALDLFLLHYVLAGRPEEQAGPLMRMAEYLHALMGPAGELPLIGDDDGGRLFYPYGDRMQFGRGTLAMCAAMFDRPEWMRSTEDLACQAAWWLGETAEAGRRNRLPHHSYHSYLSYHSHHSELFAGAGVAVMTLGDVHLAIKAGPFGEGSGGHSHSDVLSVVARLGDREILIDSGTYTYVADPAERNRFRGSGAHNTVRIDGRDQAIPAGPFRWTDKPATTIHQWSSTPDRDYLDADCAYAGFTHRRRVLFLKPAVLVVLDTVEGPAGEHCLEQFWHLAALEDVSRFGFSEPAEVTEGWRSRAFGSKESAPVLCVTHRGPLPACLAAVVDFSESPTSSTVELTREGETFSIAWGAVRVQFPIH
ncbi:MAG TPA: alginate lyase family protein, partial [Candidatus Solibacter sp.]|nr:alginate lyase family protein [Candidatus Solibacter sp.]